MSEFLSGFLLLSVPGLPLLLAFPALHSRFSWSCHLALLPALVLLAVPVAVSIEIPWMLFGTGLGIGAATRWLLAASVGLWVVSASHSHASLDQPADRRFTIFFLLTMAGNLGAILATDLVSFFTFSTLMSWGFYGLLVCHGADGADGADGFGAPRRAGRVYLGFMIVADLILFEALLMAAATTGDRGFEAVHQAMAQSAYSGSYLFMVVVGFAARAGIWPLHYWLPLAFGSSRPAVALLLGGIPVTIGLLGMVRWLPLGEITSPALGLMNQCLGVTAMLYAILAGLKRPQMKLLPAYLAITATGLFTTAVGIGLSDPAVWKEYAELADFCMVFPGVGLALLVISISWLEARVHYPAAPATQADELSSWFEHWTGTLIRWAGQMGFETLPRLHAAWLVKTGHLKQVFEWQRMLDSSERFLQRWTIAITLFLLLGVVVAVIGTSSWI